MTEPSLLPVITTVEHIERYTLTIKPHRDRPWPPVSDPEWPRSGIIHPHEIHLEITVGTGMYQGYLEGFKEKADGTLGKQLGKLRFWASAPLWAQEIIEHELSRHDLLEKALGRHAD